jgi:hypothetical protein
VALFDAISLFELGILFPQIISIGPAAPFYCSSCGFCSLELFPLGQQRRLIIRMVDYVPSNYFLWASSAVLLFELWIMFPRIISFGPAAPSYYSSCGLRSLESFLFGQQRCYPIQVVDSDFMDHFFRDYNIPLCCKVCSTLSLIEGVFITHQVYAFGPSVSLL